MPNQGSKNPRVYSGSINNRCLVKSVLEHDGTCKPLILPSSVSGGLPFCNPSVFVDNGEIWAILRGINYVLYHCETGELFNNRWGPLSYLNPEHDPHLRTTNYLCKLTPALDIERWWKIDTSSLDQPEQWEFIGLEDARLVRWDGHLYAIGVRRDTTPNGQGRMEFSELEVKDDTVKEIGRYRIEPPNRASYCEKNWMPVLDKPYQFVKWTHPLEVVEADLEKLEARQVRSVDEADRVDGVPDLRGGSQLVPWGDSYICLVHEVDLKKNRNEQKDASYRQRWVTFDKDWGNRCISESFSFLDGEIEFCAGLAEYKGDLLVTFAFQDNCSFIIRMPEVMIPTLFTNRGIRCPHAVGSPGTIGEPGKRA
jgi:hypothetical protein